MDKSAILDKNFDKLFQGDKSQKGYIVIIYGPHETDKFMEYYSDNDVLSQRAMLYYAHNNKFIKGSGTWVKEQTFLDIHKPPNNRAVEIRPNNTFEGVLVVMARYIKSKSKYIIFDDQGIYFPPAIGLYKDKFYPIDVKVLDKTYYKDDKGKAIDFFGIGFQAKLVAGGNIFYQSGSIYTYTKGLGFRKFTLDLNMTTDIFDASLGIIGVLGKYKSNSIDEQINYGRHQIWGEHKGNGSNFDNGNWKLKVGLFAGKGVKLAKTVKLLKKVAKPSNTIALNPYQIDQTKSGSKAVRWEDFLKERKK